MSLALDEEHSTAKVARNLRYALPRDAAANGVTVLVRTGATGRPRYKSPSARAARHPRPHRRVAGLDPLGGVGGTASAVRRRSTSGRWSTNVNPRACQDPAAIGQAEIVGDEPRSESGPGVDFSHFFSRPDYQTTRWPARQALRSRRKREVCLI